MGKQPDVLVVGGGIIGLTSAFRLAQAGFAVQVIDRGDLGREASWAGAGIVPPGNPDRAATPIDRLRAFSTSRFPALSTELRELTGVDNGYRQCGGVEFWPTAEAGELTELRELWAGEGIRALGVTPASLADIEPHVRFPEAVAAVRFPDMAQVRNPWHLRALVAACVRVGVRLTPDARPDAWERIDAGWRVLAAGAWSGGLLERLGVTLPVHPIRGQIVLFRPAKPLLSHVVLFGKRYLVPRADGRVLVGSTEEPEAGFEKANTPEGVRGLVAFARGLVPALADAEVEKTWAGLRPGSPDGLPYIDRGPGNVIVATGHGRAGVQLSAGTAEAVVSLVKGEPPPVPLDAFRLNRTPDPTVRPAFRS